MAISRDDSKKIRSPRCRGAPPAVIEQWRIDIDPDGIDDSLPATLDPQLLLPRPLMW